MNKKEKVRVVSVIDIGSYAVRMKVAQSHGEKSTVLDYLEYPIGLGHEVFTGGKISFDSMKKLSGILKNYSKVCKEYGVSRIKIVATTALRESSNRAYVLDRLSAGSNLQVEVLEDGQETALIYSGILRELAHGSWELGNMLISYVGTGSIGILVVQNGEIKLIHNIDTGSLRLNDVLSGVMDNTRKFDQVVLEYLESLFQRFEFHFDFSAIDTIVLTGRETELIAELCGAEKENGVYTIQIPKLNQVYNSLRQLTPDQISGQYGYTTEQSELLYALLSIYYKFADLSGAERLLTPGIDFTDVLLNNLLFRQQKHNFENQKYLGALSSARELALRYRCNMAHLDQVDRFAREIFDFLRVQHGIPQKRRLLIELAALLHNTGYYVGSQNSDESSSYIIKNSDIFGCDENDRLLLVNITNYPEDPSEEPGPWFDDLSEKDRLLAAKLAAILKLADALDHAKTQKIHHIDLNVKKDRLVVTAYSDADLSLESLAFLAPAEFFEDVYGLSPVLEIKNTLIK